MTRSNNAALRPGSFEQLEARLCLAAVPIGAVELNPDGLAFKPPVQSQVGPSTLLASDDFNGDNIPDLVSADRGHAGGRLLYGLGDGRFVPPLIAVVPPAGPAVTAVATGDFTGDGIPDAIFANDVGNSNGTLTLLPGPNLLGGAKTIWVGARPSSLAVGDFNGDHKLDVMVGHALQWTPQFSLAPARYGGGVLLGNGDGTFQPERLLPMTGPQTHVAAGDVTGDGRMDAVFAGPNLLLANPIGAAQLYTVIGSNTGAFGVVTSPAFAGALRGLALGDLNRDGRADVAAVQSPGFNLTDTAAVGESAAWTLLSNGDGKYTAAATVGTRISDPAGVSVADFGLDGRLDVAVAGTSVLPTADPLPPGAVAILRGSGTGKLAPPALFRTFYVPAVQVVIDADLDHRPDVVTGHALGVTALLNASRPIGPTPFSGESDLMIDMDPLSNLLSVD